MEVRGGASLNAFVASSGDPVTFIFLVPVLPLQFKFKVTGFRFLRSNQPWIHLIINVATVVLPFTSRDCAEGVSMEFQFWTEWICVSGHGITA